MIRAAFRYVKCILICLFSIAASSSKSQSIELVDDINPNSDSNPSCFFVYNGKLYFDAYVAAYGTEFWSTDGTAGGTSLVKDIYPGGGSSIPKLPILYNGKMYFTASDSVSVGIWESDGTQGGTALVRHIVSNFGEHNYSVIYNGEVYFAASDSAHGKELWASDGTPAGTRIFADIYPGTAASSPYALTVFGGRLYFRADDGIHGDELWTSDGTASGTVLFKDTYLGGIGSQIDGITVFNDAMYFSAEDTAGAHIWKTDGTSAGTVILSDSIKALRGGRNFTPIGLLLYFAGDDSVHGSELWVTDGSTSGTRLISDLFAGQESGNPAIITPYKGKVFFAARNSPSGVELWQSDGSTSGTSVVSFFDLGIGGELYGGFPLYHGKMYFVGYTSHDGNELWATDGTSSGTLEILPTGTANPDALFFNSGQYPVYNNALYFAAFYTDIGNELYRVTDTAAYTGVRSLSMMHTACYPDPAVSWLHISCDRPVSRFEVSDMDGRMVMGGDGPSGEIQVGVLESGMYLLHITDTAGESAVMRFVKE